MGLTHRDSDRNRCPIMGRERLHSDGCKDQTDFKRRGDCGRDPMGPPPVYSLPRHPRKPFAIKEDALDDTRFIPR